LRRCALCRPYRPRRPPPRRPPRASWVARFGSVLRVPRIVIASRSRWIDSPRICTPCRSATSSSRVRADGEAFLQFHAGPQGRRHSNRLRSVAQVLRGDAPRSQTQADHRLVFALCAGQSVHAGRRRPHERGAPPPGVAFDRRPRQDDRREWQRLAGAGPAGRAAILESAIVELVRQYR